MDSTSEGVPYTSVTYVDFCIGRAANGERRARAGAWRGQRCASPATGSRSHGLCLCRALGAALRSSVSPAQTVRSARSRRCRCGPRQPARSGPTNYALSRRAESSSAATRTAAARRACSRPKTRTWPDALLLFSYPLHPPTQPDKKRTAHFPQLRTPAMFVHGAKDAFGSPEEMRTALRLPPAPTSTRDSRSRRPRPAARQIRSRVYRRRAISEFRQMMANDNLVVITGGPGSGKTTLSEGAGAAEAFGVRTRSRDKSFRSKSPRTAMHCHGPTRCATRN